MYGSMKIKIRIKVLCVVLVFFFLPECAINPVTGKRDFMLLSESQEIAMGKKSDPEIIRYFGLYDNKDLQRFINEKSQQMVAISHRKNLKYEFKIVDSPVVNAFAVPGGYVYFTRGIMAHFNNEAEFAGVLGHEIGHITARHSAKQYSNAMLAQAGLVAGVLISPDVAQFANEIQQGVALLFLKFGRDAETQSDKLGAEYSTKINYDAQEMAHFFETLQRLEKKSGADQVPDFLSTHPNPADRENKVEKEAAKWKKKTHATNLKVNGDSYLKMIDGIVYGDDPRQGFTEDNVFYHPVLKFQFPYPDSWLVQNSPEQVQFGPKDGKAMMMFALAQGSSAEDAAQKLVQNYKLTVQKSKHDDVHGNKAVVLIADQQANPEQQVVRTLIYVIEHGTNIYAMIGASAKDNFDNYYDDFSRSMNGFRTLTDPDRLNKQPERIKIESVRSNGTLKEAMESFNMPEKRLEELAILNGMKLNERVARGTLIKVLED
jgi:predicted Zn-dependent protease